jgi:hypothetical protein
VLLTSNNPNIPVVSYAYVSNIQTKFTGYQNVGKLNPISNLKPSFKTKNHDPQKASISIPFALVSKAKTLLHISSNKN